MQVETHHLLKKIRAVSNSLFVIVFLLSGFFLLVRCSAEKEQAPLRERISINEGWRFFKYNSSADADQLLYDIRPEILDKRDYRPADEKPAEAAELRQASFVLKPWIMPTGNDFIMDPAKQYLRPEGDPGSDFPFVQAAFNDSSWDLINLPHDWAVDKEFYQGWDAEVGGGMGRLPSHGVAWYRKDLSIPAEDKGKSVFLEVDGAMSYAMVWLNGHLVGGWPFGYASWRVDLTPYIVPGGKNQLAIRLDNPNNSSRWYPGGGIYRNVWLVKTNPVHVAQWGTTITTPEVSKESATVKLKVTIDNDSESKVSVESLTEIFALDEHGNKSGKAVAAFQPRKGTVNPGEKLSLESSVIIKKPKLWGPPPTQAPNMYLAVTTLKKDGEAIDQYETRFGIRSLTFNPDQGILVNGEHIPIQGVNQHHDLGALGAAFNLRAAQRQLEILREMGCNAIRMSHNPPAPELLELTDQMGFLVMDESFDVWEMKKTPHDYHLIFPEWHEQDMRALVRRDRNHPSVIIWSVGNEVGEQYTDEEGAAIAKRLKDITHEEDPTRPVTSAMNWAKPGMPLPDVLDLISLNYQGEGIRQSPEFIGTDRIRTPPQYEANHKTYPDKVVLSSESASAFSSRGIYLFPVTDQISDIVRDGRGGDAKLCQVSAYELHAVDFGSSADKVFRSIEQHPFVAGQFVWTGWDHLGEPTPYYESRSSYCGIIDMAGFKKDRFYLYQSQWRPDLPMAHILPHWNWPDRIGKITPVHVFTSGNEAELFLNGKSLGKKKKGEYEYRLRWDDVNYEPGVLKVVAYHDGKVWAEDSVKTAGEAAGLEAVADRSIIRSDGKDLAFITVTVTDKDGSLVPTATNKLSFSLEGPGEIVATDNGNPMDMVSLSSHVRNAFSGKALVIIRGEKGKKGTLKLKVTAPELKETEVLVTTN
ncbi:MAG: DUF4982 domain-containing protein [Bacteroidales bacterium]|nr:DUF4982 domain-containing protein [Bacteroidales bacterium]